VSATQTGDTPLHMAATKGDVAIVRALLDMGADPLVENLVRPCVACHTRGLCTRWMACHGTSDRMHCFVLCGNTQAGFLAIDKAALSAHQRCVAHLAAKSGTMSIVRARDAPFARGLARQLVWCDDRGCGGVAQFKRVAFRHATIVAKLREAEATIARLQAAHADSGDAGGVTSNNNAPPAPPPALPKARLRIATEEPVLLPSPRLAPQQSEQARQLHRSVSPITAGTDSPMLSPRRLSPRRKKVSGV